MKHDPGSSDLSDAALDAHIADLQAKIDGLNISLHLANAEKTRRIQKDSVLISSAPQPQVLSSSPTFRIGSIVKIKNKYRGNKGKIGKIIVLSSTTATVQIPNQGNFVKYLHNLELLPSDQDETGR